MKKFKSEEEMSNFIGEYISENICHKFNLKYLAEFEGLFGIPDYIIFNKQDNKISFVISFELKLKDWKKGLTQAFRYRCFSHKSYVIMDELHIKNPLKHIKEFEHFNIGLASFNSKNDFKIYFSPVPVKPFSSFLYRKLEKNIFVNNEKQENNNNKRNWSVFTNPLEDFENSNLVHSMSFT